MKPGYKTTEFWLTLLMAMAACHATVDQSIPVSKQIAIVAVAGAKAIWYFQKRAEAKAQPYSGTVGADGQVQP